MQQREKVLLAVVVALVALVGLRYGYGSLEELFTARSTRIEALEKEIDRKELLISKGRLASRQMVEYESRSLPPDRDMARSLYQNWLVELVEGSGLTGGVSSQASQSQRASLSRLSFRITGQGTLAQVVKLMHAFYTADHLHQVRLLTLKPLEGGKRFDVLLSIEAVSLPSAPVREELSTAVSERLKLADFAAYEKPIVARNIFAPYVPPRPVTPRPTVAENRPPPAFDAAKYTTVSAILEVRGAPQVWFNNRTTGDVLRLGEGGAFQVGGLRGTVHRIGERDVEILVDGQRLLLALGETLRDGSPLPDGDL